MDDQTSRNVIVGVVLFVSLVSLALYYTGISVPTVGATITSSSSLAQCDDTGSACDLASCDSVFTRSSVRRRTRASATAAWPSSWTTAGIDTCLTGAGAGSLREWSCASGSASAVVSTVACANGCSTGKCNLPPCSDPDAGAAALTTLGTTTGLMVTDPATLGVPPSTQAARTYTDSCVSSSSVYEYSCTTGGAVTKTSRACSTVGSGYTCSAGRCVPPVVACVDSDADGYRNPTSPAGCTMTGTADCNDADATVYPGAGDVCGNGVDEDCSGADLPCVVSAETICDNVDNNRNGVVDEGCDDDNDNYCDAAMTKPYGMYPTTCSLSSYWSTQGDDCDDMNAAVHPGYGITDACGAAGDGVDNDCDGTVDEGFQEACDGVDNDCNGVVDGNSTVANVCTTCTDSDGGNVPTISGSTSITYPDGYSYISLRDVCRSSTTLNESICTPYYGGSRGEHVVVDCALSDQTCIDPNGPYGPSSDPTAYCG